MAVLQRQERDKEVNKVFLQEMAGAKAAVCNQDPKLHGVLPSLGLNPAGDLRCPPNRDLGKIWSPTKLGVWCAVVAKDHATVAVLGMKKHGDCGCSR